MYLYMYPNLIIVFSKISSKEPIKSENRFKANTLLTSLLGCKTILIVHVYVIIFSITGPLSR